MLTKVLYRKLRLNFTHAPRAKKSFECDEQITDEHTQYVIFYGAVMKFQWSNHSTVKEC